MFSKVKPQGSPFMCLAQKLTWRPLLAWPWATGQSPTSLLLLPTPPTSCSTPAAASRYDTLRIHPDKWAVMMLTHFTTDLILVWPLVNILQRPSLHQWSLFGSFYWTRLSEAQWLPCVTALLGMTECFQSKCSWDSVVRCDCLQAAVRNVQVMGF